MSDNRVRRTTIASDDDPASLWYLATIKAYRAYNDSSMLDYASTGWAATTKYLITPENAASGTHAAKNVTFNSTCQGGTFSRYGDSFARSDETVCRIHSWGSVPGMYAPALSAVGSA